MADNAPANDVPVNNTPADQTMAETEAEQHVADHIEFPTLTMYNEKHKQRYQPYQYLVDLTSFPYPADYLQQYPALLQSCIRVATLYERLSAERDKWVADIAQDEGKEKRLHKIMKRRRREVAPQLLLGLRDLNMGSHVMDAVTRKRVDVVEWSKLVGREITRYRGHEPVASLYVPYLKRSNLYVPDETISRAFKMGGDMRELQLARDTAIFKLGNKVEVLKGIKYVMAPDDSDRQNNVEVRKLNEAKLLLEEGLEEWFAIKRHVATLYNFSRYENEIDLWRQVLEQEVPAAQMDQHIEDLDTFLTIVKDMLASK